MKYKFSKKLTYQQCIEYVSLENHTDSRRLHPLNWPPTGIIWRVLTPIREHYYCTFHA